MSQFQKTFGADGLGKLSTGIAKAVRAGSERGNPGGDGKSVSVEVAAGTGSASVEARAKYATVAGWSALPTTPGIAFTLSDGILSVKTDSGFTGTVYFWTYA